MRKAAESVEASAVLTNEGRFLSAGFEDNNARIPTFAAVSPKRAVSRPSVSENPGTARNRRTKGSPTDREDLESAPVRVLCRSG